MTKFTREKGFLSDCMGRKKIKGKITGTWSGIGNNLRFAKKNQDDAQDSVEVGNFLNMALVST